MIRKPAVSPIIAGLSIRLPQPIAEGLTPYRIFLLGLAVFIVLVAAFPLLWMASTLVQTR